MAIKIALIRHGDAPFHPIDSLRQLSALGKEEAAQTANYLKEIGFRPSVIIHSGYDRARDTAEIIREKIASHLECEISPDLKPSAAPSVWENNLMIWDKDTLLISHMPYLPMLVERLCGKSINFPTAGCVILEKENPEDAHWKLVKANF